MSGKPWESNTRKTLHKNLVFGTSRTLLLNQKLVEFWQKQATQAAVCRFKALFVLAKVLVLACLWLGKKRVH